MQNKSVKLIECFASYQGEGPDSGRSMLILRFKYCNRNCPWCDTKVKMHTSIEAPYQLSDIQKVINEKHCGILVTGGEPTIDRHFNDTVMLLNELNYPIANVESNGFRLIDLVKQTTHNDNVKFIFSPKLFTDSDYVFARTATSQLLEEHGDCVFLKVVYENRPLVTSYLSWLSSFAHEKKLFGNIWLMPEGTTRVDVLKNSGDVLNVCEKYKFNFSSRNHIIFGFI